MECISKQFIEIAVSTRDVFSKYEKKIYCVCNDSKCVPNSMSSIIYKERKKEVYELAGYIESVHNFYIRILDGAIGIKAPFYKELIYCVERSLLLCVKDMENLHDALMEENRVFDELIKEYTENHVKNNRVLHDL